MTMELRPKLTKGPTLISPSILGNGYETIPMTLLFLRQLLHPS
jgi:hypothetical protein